MGAAQASIKVEPLITADKENDYYSYGFKITSPVMTYSFVPEYEDMFSSALTEAIRQGKDYSFASCECDGYFAITIKDGWLECDNASYGDGVRGESPFRIQLAVIKEDLVRVLEDIEVAKEKMKSHHVVQ